MSNMPNIISIDNVKVGDTPVAVKLEKLLRTYEDPTVGLQAVADRTLVTPWSVYRWLRGSPCRPRRVEIIDTMVMERCSQD